MSEKKNEFFLYDCDERKICAIVRGDFSQEEWKNAVAKSMYAKESEWTLEDALEELGGCEIVYANETNTIVY